MPNKTRKIILTTHSGVVPFEADCETCEFSMWELLMHDLGVEFVSRETQTSRQQCKILVMELMSSFIRGTGIDK